MTITIDDEYFDAQEITQLYTAAVIKTGDEDETTQVSLEWLETEGTGKLEVVGYGLFVYLGKDEKHTFMYDTREEMDAVSAKVSDQIRKKRNGM